MFHKDKRKMKAKIIHLQRENTEITRDQGPPRSMTCLTIEKGNTTIEEEVIKKAEDRNKREVTAL